MDRHKKSPADALSKVGAELLHRKKPEDEAAVATTEEQRVEEAALQHERESLTEQLERLRTQVASNEATLAATGDPGPDAPAG